MSSSYQLPFDIQAHQNHYLFSDYYLNNLIQDDEHWNDDSDLQSSFAEIQKLFKNVSAQLSTLKKERRNEEKFIMPVLDILGHHYELQPPVPTLVEGTKSPDYAFFMSEEVKLRAADKLGKREYFNHATALGDAKYWERPLDKKERKDRLDPSNPNYKMKEYLDSTKLNWAILTNGPLWRIYHRGEETGRFYQVNLIDLLQIDNVQKFKYFYHFFRVQAFVPSLGKAFLDRVLEGSVRYATGVGDELTQSVYDALEEAAKGFLAWEENALSTKDLEEIYDNCLILLYRLLFILYAEDRKLLPVETNRSYDENYSLGKLKVEIREKLTETLSVRSDLYWTRVKNLFRIINKGDPELGVPEYNGGLFKPEPEKNGFLEKKQISDRHIAKVIDLLARTFVKKGKEKELDFVSYRDLQIRHLGSIYEGLLEHRFKVAGEKLYSVKEKGREKVVTSDDVKGKRILREIKAGEIYLATDKSERKATGSYYTPDYIVKYIVENTLGPLTKGKSPEEVLEVNVLDPAMGSGHFLVRATEFLAEAIATHPGIKAHADIDDENELNFWKRQVVERCIYGVDLNPLAVELAKLSLWLATVAKDKPLSFLDHHLRCGNSLIGAKLRDIGYLPVKKSPKRKKLSEEQLSFVQEEWFKQDVWHFLKLEKDIERKESVTKKAIEEKYNLLATLEKARQKYTKIADLWTSSYFGNTMDDSVYRATVEGIRDRAKMKLSEKKHKDIFDESVKLAKARKFFHWELEFPEIFFDEYGRPKDNPGFHALIGNPPYEAELDKKDKRYLSSLFKLTKGNYNTANVFIEFAGATTRSNGFWSLIVPKSVSYSSKWMKTREYIVPNLLKVADVSRAFEEVLLEQIVLLCHKSMKPAHFVETFLLTDKTSAKEIQIEKEALDDLGILLCGISSSALSIALKVHKTSAHFSSFAYIKRGFLLQDYLTAKAGVEVYRGDDIGRYTFYPPQGFITKKVFETMERNFEYMLASKIMIQNIIAHVKKPKEHIIMMCCFDKQGKLNLDNVGNIFITSDKYNPSFFVALVNSTFLSWYLYHFVYASAIRTMRYDQYHLERTPVPIIVFSTSRGVRRELLLKLKNEYRKSIESEEILSFSSAAEFRNSKVGKVTRQHLSSSSVKSDVVHDFLAYLAEQMTNLNKRKQKEVSGFLQWLSSEIKIDVKDLKFKTRIREYHHHELDSLLDVLRANKITVSRALRESIQKEFASSLKKLKPLKAKISATDNLIDQIVYLLYGLTDDEIKIVEGKEEV